VLYLDRNSKHNKCLKRKSKHATFNAKTTNAKTNDKYK
jgi:hypothetical protein